MMRIYSGQGVGCRCEGAEEVNGENVNRDESSVGNISFMTFRAFMRLKDKFENISGKLYKCSKYNLAINDQNDEQLTLIIISLQSWDDASGYGQWVYWAMGIKAANREQ